MKNKAVIHKSLGGPEVMEVVEEQIAAPADKQILVRNQASGINFIDIYHRTGLYPSPLPARMGFEGAGVVEGIGPGVSRFKSGDKVAYRSSEKGSYAQYITLAENDVIHLPDGPDGITPEVAAASMLKGLTAEYLVRRTYPLKPGETILVQAAAGGVGLILVQWARSLGATVIGTAGGKEKTALAKAHGCHHVIDYLSEDFHERVMEITEGKGVPVVYDSVGKDTFQKSLNCLSPFGLMVSYGNASGAVPPVPLTDLKGSLFLTRPSLFAFLGDPKRYQEMADNLFQMIQSGKVKIEITGRYPLEEAAQAHRDLEGRKTTGSIILAID